MDLKLYSYIDDYCSLLDHICCAQIWNAEAETSMSARTVCFFSCALVVSRRYCNSGITSRVFITSLSVCSSIAMSIPTFFDLPATTTFFPRVGMPVCLIISQTSHGVADNIEYWSKHICPTLIIWKPSASVSGETALQIFLPSVCSGRGYWTRRPSMLPSLFSFLI